MMVYSGADIALDANGNFYVRSNEIALASPSESVGQVIEWRLKTDPVEWPSRPAVCAGIPSLKGRMNTEETAELIKTRIFQALTSDGFMVADEFNVDVLPVPVDGKLSDRVVIVIELYDFANPVESYQRVEYWWSFSFDTGKIYGIAPSGNIESDGTDKHLR